MPKEIADTEQGSRRDDTASHNSSDPGDGDRGVVRWSTGTDADTGVLVNLEGHTDGVLAVACTRRNDRPVAVTGGKDRTVRVWDIATGAQLLVITGYSGLIRAIACTTLDGHPVAITCGDESVRVWDLATGSQLRILNGHNGSVSTIDCARLDGRPVAVTGGKDRTVRVWDIATGIELRTIVDHSDVAKPISPGFGRPVGDGVRAVACTALDGRPVVVSCGGDGAVRVWDLATGTQLRTLTGQHADARAVACTELNGHPVAVTSSNYTGSTQVWDLATGTHQLTFNGHASSVGAVACTKFDNHSVVVRCDQEGSIHAWDLATGTQLQTLTGQPTDPWAAVACAELDDHPIAVTGSYNNTVKVWDFTIVPQRSPRPGYTHRVLSVACGMIDGRPVVISRGHDPATTEIWDLRTGAPIPVQNPPTFGYNQTSYEPVTIAGSPNGPVEIRDHTLRSLVHALGSSAYATAEVEGRTVVITGHSHGRVQVWNPDTGEMERDLSDYDETEYNYAIAHNEPLFTDFPVTEVRMSLGERPITFARNKFGLLRAWDLATGELLHGSGIGLDGHGRIEVGHLMAHGVLAGHPVAVTGKGDVTVRVWDRGTGKALSAHDFPRRVHTAACADDTLVVGYGNDITALNYPGLTV